MIGTTASMATSPYFESNSRAASERRAAGRSMVALAASTRWAGAYERTGTDSLEPVPVRLVRRCLLGGLLTLDHLRERRLSVLDGVEAVVGQRRVSVLVDGVGAQHAVAVLGVVDQLLRDRCAVVGLTANGLQRGQSEAHRLVAVDGVRVRRLVVVGRVEVLEELDRLDDLAILELFEAQRGNRDLGPVAYFSGDAALLRVGE